jgi:hypothetical protein
VYNSLRHIVARVDDVFPAAVCVKVPILALHGYFELLVSPQLWRADDIENVSVCRSCGSRDHLLPIQQTGVPFRICTRCAAELRGERIQAPTQD